MRHSLLFSLLCYLTLAGGYWLVTPALEAPREEDCIERASLCALNGNASDAYTTVLAAGLGILRHPDLIATTLPSDGPGALRLQHGLDEVLRSDEQRVLSSLRALSLLLGMVSLVCTHFAARAVFRHSGVAAVATLTMACMPQWACSHAVLWHGALLAAAAHCAVLVAARGAGRARFALAEGVAAGAAAALALWTAPAGWFVVAVVALAHALALRAQPRAASTWRSLGGFAMVTAAGWLLAAPVLPLPPLPPAGRGTFDLVRSFVGEFGRHALPLPWAPLLATVVMIGAAIAGWAFGAARLAPQRAALSVLTASCSLGSVAGVQAALHEGHHGRGLLIALGPMLVLTGAGMVAAWRRLVPARAQAWAAHPGAILLPFAPSLLVLLLQVAPQARVQPSRDPAFATLHSGLRTATGRTPAAEVIVVAPGSATPTEGDEPPTLRWQDLGDLAIAGDDRVSVLGWRDDFTLLFATYERDGRAIGERSWRVPDDVFARLRPGERFAWRVRRLGDRRFDDARWLAAPRWFTRTQ